MSEQDQNSSSGNNETIIIKRYASRKLYDAAAKEYVTLEDIARYIRNGHDVKVIDKKTGEDLTRQYLLQIITDYESKGENVLPLNILTDIVRQYQSQAGSIAPAFLSQAFEMFKTQQEKVLGEMSTLTDSVFDPKNVIESMQSWQNQQTEFFGNTLQKWGLNNQESKKGADSTVDLTKTNNRENKSSKLEEMEAQLKALQEQLNKLR